jgi:glycosyltransferase involved in cell wall biosynthesis
VSPQRILYVIGQLGVGGGERQLFQLIEGLDQSRFAPELVSFEEGGHLEKEFARLCPVHVMHKTRATELKVFIALTRLLRKMRPRILHTYLFPSNWRGALAGSIAGGPITVQFVGNLGVWMGPARRTMERWATRAADAVIFEAPRIGEFLTQRIGVRKDRLSMIPNGVNLEVYHPAEAGWPGRAAIREELFKGEGLLIVGAVMSLLPKKNPFLLVDSAARVLKEIPRARFFIAGDGPLRSEVEERIREHGIGDKFRLLGIRRDIPELFRAIDMLALCSDREGCPNVVLEAMASGLPVVATYAGGTDQLVKDGENGRLVAIRDTDRFTEALTDLLDRPAAAALMGRKGLERVRENFSLQRMVDRTQELYEELLRHRSNGRSR